MRATICLRSSGGVAAEDQRATVGGREVDVEHLDGGKPVERGPAASGRSLDLTIAGTWCRFYPKPDRRKRQLVSTTRDLRLSAIVLTRVLLLRAPKIVFQWPSRESRVSSSSR